MICVDGGADADADELADTVDGDRPYESLPETTCNRRDVGSLVKVSKDDGELVPAKARCGVVLEDVGVKATAYLLQNEVTLVMAECVVQLLEAVQVEHQEGYSVPTRLRRRDDCSIQGLFERSSVGQPGEVVETGSHA